MNRCSTGHVYYYLRYKVQTVESLWQSILKHSSNKKDRKTFNAVFLFACMERLIKLLKGRWPHGMLASQSVSSLCFCIT